ncbi:MAG: nucleotidyl transferase AbiEii/AbiGii toxin family protein [Dorea sp.]|nr:nucleotidyl transferase AbiEii/AbiGii toxin family protein [Dorea sp.]
MNLLEEIEKLKNEGYSETNAQARVCQDIILYGISKGRLRQNVTIKGGVVIRNISKDARRATQDIDLDFIRYSISNDSIEAFLNQLYMVEGLHISLKAPIVELNHRDYKGKRAFVEITDEHGNCLESKIDVGVHKDLEVEQEDFCFDICFQEDGASLLMNSKEQIITEKLKSFLRFGTRSTRYKDVFDICYLSESIDKARLREYIRKYIYEDAALPVENINEIIRRVERVFTDRRFIKEINKSKKNWMDISEEEALEKDIEFVKSL